LEIAQSLFEEREKDSIEATEKIFRTAYECAHSQLSFAEHSRLVTLQQRNGVQCGDLLQSDHACANIVEHIAKQMRSEITKHIIEQKTTFAVMIDESTSCANDQSLIVYLRTLYEDTACVYFFGLVAVEQATADAILTSLLNFLHVHGLTDDILKEQLVGFCSDGASTTMGRIGGVATLLQKNMIKCRYFIAWHIAWNWQ